MRSLLTTFSHQAFALVSLGYVNGSLPCTEDILVHCGVFAGGKTGRPTTTSESNFNMVNIIIIQLVMLKSNSIRQSVKSSEHIYVQQFYGSYAGQPVRSASTPRIGGFCWIYCPHGPADGN